MCLPFLNIHALSRLWMYDNAENENNKDSKWIELSRSLHNKYVIYKNDWCTYKDIK